MSDTFVIGRSKPKVCASILASILMRSAALWWPRSRLSCGRSRRCCSSVAAARRLAGLVHHVDVQKLDDGAFIGKSADLGWGRVYGGQTMAQAVSAAQAVAGAERTIFEFSCHFLKGGDVTCDMRFEAETLSRGQSFSVVHVRALQREVAILSLTASFQVPERGLEHQSTVLSPGWGRPADLMTLEQHMAPHLDRIPKRMVKLYSEAPIEIRPSAFVAPWDVSTHSPERAFWVRVRGALPDDPMVHQRLLTYISDWGLLETSLLPLPTAMWLPQMQVASLTHSIQFHRPDSFRLDGEWLCHVMRSPMATGGRGVALGEVYTEAGDLVASTSQEGLIRCREKEVT